MEASDESKRQMIWINIAFFAVTTLIALIGAPLYVARFGLHPATACLSVFYMIAGGMSITAGYHRLYAHASYKAHPMVQFLLLFFGAASYEQSAFDWASQHRTHHRYVDTPRDPYSIRKGFFYAHIGWLLFWKHPAHYENVKDLRRNRLVMHQHDYYYYWAALSGIVLPVLIGFAWGDPAGAFVLAVCARLFLVHQATFCINSVCHTFGRATYDIYSSARDHWLVALITNGEGYHNFHHHFPCDYRNGVRWYQWDPTKWLILLLAKTGAAYDLKKVSKFRIISARLAADNQRLEDELRLKALPGPSLLRTLVNSRYQRLKRTLAEWENAAWEYQTLLREHLSRHSLKVTEAAFKMKAARRDFNKMWNRWNTACLKFQAAS